MKAVQLVTYGDNGLQVNPNVEKPSLKQGQILVEVKAASINAIDWKIKLGYLEKMVPLQLPITIGGDFAGIIAQLGEGVTGFTLGSNVYGSAITLGGGSGSMAEYAATNASNTALSPKTIDFTTAAALPLVGVSAVQALEEHLKLQKEQKILIHGGAGGIGHIAIQLAKAIGAYVATTVRSNDISFAKELGADEVIDFKAQKFEELLKDFDAVYDTVGGQTQEKSFLVLKKGGILVSMNGKPSEELANKYGVTVIGQQTRTTTERLTRLAQLVDEGKIKVHIDKVFSIDEAVAAFSYQEKNHPRGKTVIKIADTA